MNWTSLKNLIGHDKYYTDFSKISLKFVFIFRLLVSLVACEKVFGDEQRDFDCNTRQPGCLHVCYNYYFPISHTRLWTLQVLFVTCPSFLVILHVKYREKQERKPKHKEERKRSYEYPEQKRGGLWWTYFLSLIFKIVVDIVFTFLLFYIYKSFFPLLVKCTQDPCPNVVDCYIARPTEKKIFTIFMVVTSFMSILLSLLEALYMCKNKLHKHCGTENDPRMTRNWAYETYI